MRSRFLLSAFVLHSLMAAIAVGQGEQAGTNPNASAPAPPINSLVRRMQDAQEGARPQVAYQEIRKYRLFPSNNSNAASEVVAEVDFRMPSTKNYSIQQSTGSGRAEEVVRHILHHEARAAAEGQHVPDSAVTGRNYDFSYLGQGEVDGQPCYLVQLTPRRKDKNLIAGTAWVDSRSFLIRQLEGDLVKSPSWWIKKVHVKLNFGDVAGTWVQTAVWALADVRVFGSHTLTSELVDHRNVEVVASKPSKGPRLRRSPAALATATSN